MTQVKTFGGNNFTTVLSSWSFIFVKLPGLFWVMTKKNWFRWFAMPSLLYLLAIYQVKLSSFNDKPNNLQALAVV